MFSTSRPTVGNFHVPPSIYFVPLLIWMLSRFPCFPFFPPIHFNHVLHFVPREISIHTTSTDPANWLPCLKSLGYLVIVLNHTTRFQCSMQKKRHLHPHIWTYCWPPSCRAAVWTNGYFLFLLWSLDPFKNQVCSHKFSSKHWNPIIQSDPMATQLGNTNRAPTHLWARTLAGPIYRLPVVRTQK